MEAKRLCPSTSAPRAYAQDERKFKLRHYHDEALLAHDLDRIAAIDRALEKIRENTYGFSDGNGEPIGRAHLEAVPEAILTADELRARHQ